MPETIETTAAASNMELPSDNLIQYVMDKTAYKDPHFVAASIIAARFDDPQVPHDIVKVLRGEH